MSDLPAARPEPTAEIRPERVAAIRRPGLIPRRLLMFGGGVLTGVGHPDHGAALPGAVADALARRSRRGVDITVIVESDPLSKRALEGLRGLRLHRFDAVIVMLAPPAGPKWTSVGRRRGGLERLTELLDSECAHHAPAFVYDSPGSIPDDMGTQAEAAPSVPLPHDTEGEDAATSRVRFRELPPPPSVLELTAYSRSTYEGWADLIVERLNVGIADLKALHAAEAPRSAVEEMDDEDLRQRALRGLRLQAAEQDGSLEFLLRQTKLTFRSAGAALVIVDGETVRPVAVVGAAAPTLPRDAAFSNITIQSDRPTVIGDALQDPRVPAPATTPGLGTTRFYAGHAVHTWDGYRIGALCVYDDEPREMTNSDLIRLWEFAGKVEQELWSSALRSGACPSAAPRSGHRLRARSGATPAREPAVLRQEFDEEDGGSSTSGGRSPGALIRAFLRRRTAVG